MRQSFWGPFNAVKCRHIAQAACRQLQTLRLLNIQQTIEIKVKFPFQSSLKKQLLSYILGMYIYNSTLTMCISSRKKQRENT